MTFGLVDANYSLPEWQAVKLTFFASCLMFSKSSLGYAPFELTRNDDGDNANGSTALPNNLIFLRM